MKRLGNCVVLQTETSNFSQISRKSRVWAEVYSRTPQKQTRQLMKRFRERAVSGRELADFGLPGSLRRFLDDDLNPPVLLTSFGGCIIGHRVTLTPTEGLDAATLDSLFDTPSADGVGPFFR